MSTQAAPAAPAMKWYAWALAKAHARSGDAARAAESGQVVAQAGR